MHWIRYFNLNLPFYHSDTMLKYILNILNTHPSQYVIKLVLRSGTFMGWNYSFINQMTCTTQFLLNCWLQVCTPGFNHFSFPYWCQKLIEQFYYVDERRNSVQDHVSLRYSQHQFTWSGLNFRLFGSIQTDQLTLNQWICDTG